MLEVDNAMMTWWLVNQGLRYLSVILLRFLTLLAAAEDGPAGEWTRLIQIGGFEQQELSPPICSTYPNMPRLHLSVPFASHSTPMLFALFSLQVWPVSTLCSFSTRLAYSAPRQAHPRPLIPGSLPGSSSRVVCSAD